MKQNNNNRKKTGVPLIREVIVCFVYIGGIYDDHCLDCFFYNVIGVNYEHYRMAVRVMSTKIEKMEMENRLKFISSKLQYALL